MPITYGDVVTLGQAKLALGITDDSQDALLAQIVSSASTMWQRRVGPVAASCDEWYDGGSPQIVLRHTPVVAVSQVQESWGPINFTLDVLDLSSGTFGGMWTYTVDLDAGILTRRASGVAQSFAYGTRNVHVVYTAGYAQGTIPADVVEGALLLVTHLWGMQRANPTGGGTGATDPAPMVAGAWPQRAEEIAATLLTPGIA